MDDIRVTDIVNYSYCPRRAWLGAQGDEVEHEHRVHGADSHRKVDGASPRSVRNSTLGIVGVPDVVRGHGGGVEIVEHKSTPGRRVPSVSDENLVQLAVYRSCLEDSGETVTAQSVWFSEHSRMVRVTDEEIGTVDVAALASSTREVLEGVEAPPVLDDDARCHGCSQVEVCIPSVELLASPKIVPRYPNGRPLYVHAQGGSIAWRKGQIVVKRRNLPDETFPSEAVDYLAVIGDVSITSAVLRELPSRGTPVLFCTHNGKCISYVASPQRPNGVSRVRVATLSVTTRYAVAAELIRAKVSNQATVLGRFPSGKDAARRIRSIRDTIPVEWSDDPAVKGARALFAAEGGCADLYFSEYVNTLRISTDVPWYRGKRPATDPINSALNFGYALLRAAVDRSILGCGLDPVDGVLHTPGRNKPALSLDLMEQFRAPVVDEMVRTLFNRGELTERDFNGVTVRLTERGRKTLLNAFGETMLRTHKYLGPELTWRRTLDYQARALLHVIDGTSPTYKALRTR